MINNTENDVHIRQVVGSVNIIQTDIPLDMMVIGSITQRMMYI